MKDEEKKEKQEEQEEDKEEQGREEEGGKRTPAQVKKRAAPVGTFREILEGMRGGGAPPAATAYRTYEQMSVQKVLNPALEELRVKSLTSLNEQVHTQTMRGLELQEKQMEVGAELQKKEMEISERVGERSEKREYRLTAGSLVIVGLMAVAGLALLFRGETAVGAWVLRGCAGFVAGVLAGFGHGAK